MRRVGKLFLLLFALGVMLTVSVFASGEPSAEPSGEPSAEPAAEQMAALSAPMEFGVTFLVNGEEYHTVSVGITVDGDEYTFEIEKLLEFLGIRLTYDEKTAVASITPAEGGFAAVLLEQALKENSPAAGDISPSAEPAQPKEVTEGPAASPIVPAPVEQAAGLLPADTGEAKPPIADIRRMPVGSFFRSAH